MDAVPECVSDRPHTKLSVTDTDSRDHTHRPTDTDPATSSSSCTKAPMPPSDESVTVSSDLTKTTSTTPAVSLSVKKPRPFQKHWLKIYSWLEYDSTSNIMTCRLCKSAGKKIPYVLALIISVQVLCHDMCCLKITRMLYWLAHSQNISQKLLIKPCQKRRVG